MEEVAAPAATDSLGESCSLDNYLSQPDHTMDARIAAARATLGTDVVLLGHHYQRDEVIRFADFTGDSYKLSKIASQTDAKYMLFCGVHFMAEIGQVEDCWDSLERAGLTGDLLPLTYMNSAAAIKAFCGENGGLVCTSS